MKGGRFNQFASNFEGKTQNMLGKMSAASSGVAEVILKSKHSKQLRSEIHLFQGSSQKQAVLI